MAIALQFGGTVIEGALHWEDILNHRDEIVYAPRRDGAIETQHRWLGDRVIRVNGTLFKATEAQLRDYIRTWNATLHSRGRDKLYFYDDNVFVNAQGHPMHTRRDAGRAPHIVADYLIDFSVKDPYWYALTPDTSTTSISASPTSFAITNSGGTNTPPIISVKATGANRTGTFKITNSTTSIFMQVGSVASPVTINQNQSLIFNVPTYRVINQGADARKDFSGWFFELAPGVNNIAYEGPVTVDITVEFNKRYL